MKTARSWRSSATAGSLWIFLRPCHEHDPREETKKDTTHPSGHAVRFWCAVMYIEHKDSDYDGKRNKYHGEKKILSDQRDDKRGGRNGLGDYQEENGEGEENGNTQRHLLATIRRKIENQNGQEGDEQTGNDHVYGVEKRQTANVERVRDIRVDLFAAVVLDIMLVPRSIDNRPFSTFPEILQVYGGPDEHQVDFGLVVGPRAELHGAVLVVEWEVCHIDLARALEDGGWDPRYISIEAEKRFSFIIHLEVSNCTVVSKKKIIIMNRQWTQVFGLMENTYLLYNTMSGFQILLEGTRMNSTPPNSFGSHLSL